MVTLCFQREVPLLNKNCAVSLKCSGQCPRFECLRGCIADILYGLFKHFCLQICRVIYLLCSETALPVVEWCCLTVVS